MKGLRHLDISNTEMNTQTHTARIYYNIRTLKLRISIAIREQSPRIGKHPSSACSSFSPQYINYFFTFLNTGIYNQLYIFCL